MPTVVCFGFLVFFFPVHNYSLISVMMLFTLDLTTLKLILDFTNQFPYASMAIAFFNIVLQRFTL